MLNSITRTVYLLCLTVTLFVAMISLLSGASFEAMVTRMALALVGSGVLGWAAILVLLPAAARPSGGQAATGSRLPAATQPSGPEPAPVEKEQAGDDRPADADAGDHATPASA